MILNKTLSTRSIPLIMLCLLALADNCALAQAMRDEYVDIDGSTLHLKIAGSEHRGTALPVIVLESGGGADSGQWTNIQPVLATELEAVVVSYDRFGLGESELPDTAYKVRAEVGALHTALKALDLGDEVILVGHSFGGLLIQNYANLWPEEVKGLLFLDPNTAGAMIALSDALFAGPAEAEPKTRLEHALARKNRATLETMVTTFQSPLPAAMPIIVVSAEQGFFPKERMNRAFRLSHQLLAASVDNGDYLIAERSGHGIHSDRPDLVISSLARLMELTAAGSRQPPLSDGGKQRNRIKILQNPDQGLNCIRTRNSQGGGRCVGKPPG